MNIDTMTLDEICDEIARRLGYRYVQSTNTASFPHWLDSNDNPYLDAESNYVHPIEQTLEESSKLPEDWIFTGVQYDFKTSWTASAITFHPERECGGGSAVTELLARFKLRLYCMITDEYYNNRRLELITKKYNTTLNEQEAKELDVLQKRVTIQVDRELKPRIDALQTLINKLP